MDYGKRIRELRLQKQLNQKELGKLLNLSGARISDYERNFKRPSIDIFVKLANALETTVDHLVDNNSNVQFEHEITDKELISNFKKISKLEKEDKRFISKVIDDLIVARKIKEFV